jgi:transcriptional regulator with XRE-family HTH domain
MAENLWAVREQKKISVAGLANRAGLPIGLIMEYESGQKSIDPRHLSRLARALYVEDSDIRLQSDPRPGTPPLERQEVREAVAAPAATAAPAAAPPAVRPPAPPRGRERSARPRSEARPPVPPRPSQLAHFGDLLIRLGRTQPEVEAAIGKPIASLDRAGMSMLLKSLQEEARKTTVERHRAYLPEGVDHYESRYLTAAVTSGRPFRFSLFDGSTVEGKVIGFGPYTITVSQTDGAEVTLNKLAVVSYSQTPNGVGHKEPGQ